MEICGINNGMVMQRGKDNCCDIFFTCSEKIASIECDCYCGVYTPSVTESGNGYRLTGIEAGGPYTLKIKSESRFDENQICFFRY